MSKAKIKKYLELLSREELVEVITDLYEARKEARDYLEFFMDPDVKGVVEKARKNVSKLYFKNNDRPHKKFNFSEGNKEVRNFLSLGIRGEEASDVMQYNLEEAISWLVVKGSMSQTSWTAVVNNFRKTVDYAFSCGTEEKMHPRFERFIAYSRSAPSHLRVEERLRQEYDEAKSLNDTNKAKEEWEKKIR